MKRIREKAASYFTRLESSFRSGSVAVNAPGYDLRSSPFSVVNEDISLARQTILRVANYPFERAVFGHGKTLDTRANQQLKERFSDAMLR